MTVQFCSKCLMPSTRPRIVFKDGVCNACENAKQQQEIDWDARKTEFLEVIDEHRSDGPYDCVVPFSGGKDSAAIAWRLKHEYGLNPLLACYGQLMWTEVGRANMDRVAKDGFDIIRWGVNGNISRRLARRFFIERGCPKIHYNAGVNAVPLRTAIAFNIPLVIYAEMGEQFYGGLVLDEESKRTRNLTEVLEHQIGDDPRNWAIDGISENELTPYIYPDRHLISLNRVRAFYFSYFHKWSIYENYQLMRDHLGFVGVQPRTDGSFENYDSVDDKIDGLDFFMMGVKFGFSRCTRIVSRLIQSGDMTREKGLALVKQYDGEFPEMYIDDVLEYLSMTRGELEEIIELHRNPELWEKARGKWNLKHPPQ